MVSNTRNGRQLTVSAALLTLLWLSPLANQQAQAQDETAQGTTNAETTQGVEDNQNSDLSSEEATEEVDPNLSEGETLEEVSVLEETQRDSNADPAPAIGTSILGATSLGFGIALLVEGGNSNDLADQAGNDGYYLYEQDLRDRAKRQRVWGGITTGFGVALLGVATYYWIDWAKERRAERRGASEDDVSFQVFPSVDPEGGGALMVTGSF